MATQNATPDDTGYSPKGKVFGRQKPSMGISLPTESLEEDISQFLERMQQHDRALTAALHEEQEKKGLAYDKNRAQPIYYKAGQRVWVKRAPGGDKHCPWWQGPCLIQKVLGNHSYQV